MTIGDLPGCALLATSAVLALGWSRLRAPLGADEGYLWYGVQQVLKGRFPHSDFRAYEPGRYLWAAPFVALAGRRQLLGLRCATHAFFALALCVALVVLRKLGLGWGEVAFAAVALTALAHPQHKQFEHGWLLFAWAANTQWLLQPGGSAPAWAAAGVGLALCLGFNLFLYGGAALVATGLIAIATGKLALDGALLAKLATGGAAGLLPFVLMCLSPRFARAFHERRIAAVLARGESNLPLPRPWPWRAVPRQLHGLDPIHQRAFQWLFLALFLVPATATVALLLWPRTFGVDAAGIIAAAALGLFAAHHAASRADPAHVTQSVGATCLLALLLAPGGIAVSILVAAVGLWLAWPLQPLAQRRARPDACRRHPCGGFGIDHSPEQAGLMEVATALCAGQAHGLFAAPTLPALYAALGRDSPVYDTFPVYPASALAQQRMVAELERAMPLAAVICNAPMDGRDELRFAHTHPAVWAYLETRFACASRPDLGRDIVVFTRAAAVSAPAARDVQAVSETVSIG